MEIIERNLVAQLLRNFNACRKYWSVIDQHCLVHANPNARTLILPTCNGIGDGLISESPRSFNKKMSH